MNTPSLVYQNRLLAFLLRPWNPTPGAANPSSRLLLARQRVTVMGFALDNGQRVEGLRALRDALRLVLEVADGLVAAPERGTAPRYANLGLSLGQHQDLSSFLDFCGTLDAVLENESGPLTSYHLKTGLGLYRMLWWRCAWAHLTPGSRTVFRCLATGGAVLGCILAGSLVSALYLKSRPPPYTVTVSAKYSNGNLARPANVLDHDFDTEWQLPDRTLGALTLTYAKPADIRRVHMVNGHNRWFLDRALLEYRLDAWSKGNVIQSTTGKFPPLERKNPWVEVPLVADNVDEVVLTVLTYQGLGGALAEIAVE